MSLSLQILCAKLGLRAYDPAFLATASLDLSDLGRELKYVIWGTDAGIGAIPYGFISTGPEGMIATFRGTQMPDGSFVEWIDDFEAVLDPCPFAPGAMWHRGFGKVYSSLAVAGTPVAVALTGIPGLICHGHSLGAPLATYAALEAKAGQLGLFASPKPGNAAFAAAVQAAILPIWSYANPNDAVPKVPITVDFPWKFEDFQPVMGPYRLNANLVTPAIPGDWGASHNLGNYLALLEALAATPTA
jgi:hypothetical protein